MISPFLLKGRQPTLYKYRTFVLLLGFVSVFLYWYFNKSISKKQDLFPNFLKQIRRGITASYRPEKPLFKQYPRTSRVKKQPGIPPRGNTGS
jgi:hypothetical protein